VPASSHHHPDRSRRARGAWGEARAVAHLQRLGHRVLDRNWRPAERQLRGELDIVATDGDVLVVCEVKARRSAGHGGAAAAVDERKQERIRHLAACWIADHDWSGDGVRFDVITIEGVRLTHFRQAF
jgi:putative endonuclease